VRFITNVILKSHSQTSDDSTLTSETHVRARDMSVWHDWRGIVDVTEEHHLLLKTDARSTSVALTRSGRVAFTDRRTVIGLLNRHLILSCRSDLIYENFKSIPFLDTIAAKTPVFPPVQINLVASDGFKTSPWFCHSQSPGQFLYMQWSICKGRIQRRPVKSVPVI